MLLWSMTISTLKFDPEPAVSIGMLKVLDWAGVSSMIVPPAPKAAVWKSSDQLSMVPATPLPCRSVTRSVQVPSIGLRSSDDSSQSGR